MIESVTQKLRWEVPESINKAVKEFVEEEVVPEIRAALLEDKDEIVNAATAFVRGIPGEIGKALQANVAGNLTKSWNLKKIVEAVIS